MDSKTALVQNLKKLKKVTGLNNKEICALAADNGDHILHGNTVTNVLAGKDFQSKTIDAFAAAFNVSPGDMINPLGFNDEGKPIDKGEAFPMDAVETAIDCVLNICHLAGVEDRAWINATIKEAAHEYIQSGPDAAHGYVLTKLKGSNVN
ncbi:hypothetical protein [Pseudoalteromonas piratica]|uniref:hypothetical protein n=1 Tax=Pseudoalteromonas piratica TaxID=1348114 RepID=UPI001901CF07|nr:hypothetical protein [Pseudoalteromonas piratica]